MEKKMSGTLVSKVLYEELRNFLSTKRKKKCKIIDISIGDDFGGVGGLGRGGNIQQNRRKGHKQSVRKRTGEYGDMV